MCVSPRLWCVHVQVVFDDSFEHEVNYEHEAPEQGQGERVVLLLDIWHPSLTEDERAAVQALFPA